MEELQLWGGHECTVVRIGDAYRDQTVLSGHHDRLDDLDRFASLGLSALRYPVLWERVAPGHPEDLDFSWSDQRLSRLAQLGVRPIIGLLHHGSGPNFTSLVDEAFPQKFAAYAGKVAARYPHVGDWAPINEPLTTARFACLYGLWHPHHRDEHAFWTALLNQIDGVRLAMQEIRKVNPAARLIQPEDFGRTYATPPLAHQAEHDNARRWMTWDLLCGRVVRGHELWDRLAGQGLADRLSAIAERPCPPQVLGVNHYLTSDRFLDHRTEAYPPQSRGANAFMPLADVEAVRVLTPAPGGLDGALEEVAARYRIPIAVTECHNGCSREEQMRWLGEAWDTAHRLRRAGVAIEAVTAWALLGAFDWNSLLTRQDGHYEGGAFDLRTRPPRPTALAGMIKALPEVTKPRHPAAEGPGWWRRDIRLHYQPQSHRPMERQVRAAWRAPGGGPRPILIAGATGTLGRAFAKACERRGLDYVLTARGQLDLDDPATVASTLKALRPWLVLNAAGWVRVDQAESRRDACFAANAQGVLRLAHACAGSGARMVSFSSDLVFDGRLGRPYVESDRPAPLSVYGASKAAAEHALLSLQSDALMVRTAAFFSPDDPHNFAAQAMDHLAAGQVFGAADDLVVSPTYVPDLVEAVLDLAIDGERGIWHLTNLGGVSWSEFAGLLAEAAGLDRNLVRAAAGAGLGAVAPRPAFSVLASERGQVMPSLESAIARFAQAWRPRAMVSRDQRRPADRLERAV